MTTQLDRRDFLKSGAAAGVGLAVYFTIPAGRGGVVEAAAKYEPNAFITIMPDGLVTADQLRETLALIRAHQPLPATSRVPAPEELLHMEPLRRGLSAPAGR